MEKNTTFAFTSQCLDHPQRWRLLPQERTRSCLCHSRHCQNSDELCLSSQYPCILQCNTIQNFQAIFNKLLLEQEWLTRLAWFTLLLFMSFASDAMAAALVFKETIFAICAPCCCPSSHYSWWRHFIGWTAQEVFTAHQPYHLSNPTTTQSLNQHITIKLPENIKLWDVQRFHFQSKKEQKAAMLFILFVPCVSTTRFAFNIFHGNKQYNGTGSHPWSFTPIPFSQKKH